jgi:formiminoglutamate deiminase
VTLFRCAAAALDGGIAFDVDIESADGVIVGVRPAGDGVPDEVFTGVVVPGFADAHSHVFHRGLRGRSHAGGGSFWTWRETMYQLAGRLTPDTLRELAFAAYVEMVCAGVTAVGEFHYLHHAPGGVPYDDPNELGLAVVQAGADAGLVVTLLDVAYLAGGFGQPLAEAQLRFGDGDVHAWAERVEALPADIRTGVAIHSVRAVPPEALPVVARAAAGRPLHVHLSEQPAENEACLAATGLTPTALLHSAGALGPTTSAVHATHLTDDDVRRLGAAGATAVICPTTEADLADGLPRIGDLAGAGVVLALGGDQHVITDPLAQLRGLEYGERLATGRRGSLPPLDLLAAATRNSHDAIGSPAGSLWIGAPADLVELDPASARTAGSLGLQLLLSASAADVRTVVTAGVVQARGGVHVRWGDPGPILARAVERAWTA